MQERERELWSSLHEWQSNLTCWHHSHVLISTNYYLSCLHLQTSLLHWYLGIQQVNLGKHKYYNRCWLIINYICVDLFSIVSYIIIKIKTKYKYPWRQHIFHREILMKFKLENMVYLKHNEQKRACLWERAGEGNRGWGSKEKRTSVAFSKQCRYTTMLISVVISGAQQGNRTFCKNGLLLTSRISLREDPLVEKAKHVFFSREGDGTPQMCFGFCLLCHHKR